MIDRIDNTKFPFVRASTFTEFTYKETDVDLQGWAGNHPVLSELIRDKSIKTICDVGVWKGQSTVHMAKTLKDMNNDGFVVAVDTFLGSPQMWYNDHKDLRQSLKLVHGYPSFYYTFLANVFNYKVENFVVPMPATSNAAYHMLETSGVTFDMIHIDAEHEYLAVKADIDCYWKLLNSGGVMVCDDYSPGWPGVFRAVNEFANDNNITIQKHSLFGHNGRKAILCKI